MNHPHLQYLRDNGAGPVADALESNADRNAVPVLEWEKAFALLSKLPRGSTLRPIVWHAIAKLSK